MIVLQTGRCSGPKGEGGLDDATGAGGSGGGASMKQSSGAVDLGQFGAGFHPQLANSRAPLRMNSNFLSCSGIKCPTVVINRQDGPRREGYCVGNGLQVALAEGWQRQASSKEVSSYEQLHITDPARSDQFMMHGRPQPCL